MAERCNFSDKHCKFPTEEITGARDFNFASEFFKMWVFSPKFCILRHIFRQEDFLTISNFTRASGAIGSPQPHPPFHQDATGCGGVYLGLKKNDEHAKHGLPSASGMLTRHHQPSWPRPTHQ